MAIQLSKEIEVRACTSERPLLLPPYIPPTQLQVQLKIDELFKAYKYYKHVHTKQSVLDIVHIAQTLQGWGYDLIIDANHRLVGCQRRPHVS